MKQNQFEPWEDNTYRTGSTTPPKSHSGLVAILLVLVIILAGLVSILGVLNIQLFSAFYETQQKEHVPLVLEVGEEQQDSLLAVEDEPLSASGNKSIGILGDPVTTVYQQHFQLPARLFITYVEENSTAYQQGLQEGDVLISLENEPISEADSLMNFLEQRNVGDQCIALVYRRDIDQQFTVTLTVEEMQ